MTAAVYRTGTPSLSVPQTQNTAPVLEFNCLYTHDVRRKQKRWQDGFVRFHTFNKRVMVYDVPRNFIGDMHWKSDEALQDGDEVTLEKVAVLVQVAESVGRTETDLTELRKSAKKKGGRNGEAGSSSPVKQAAQTPKVRIGSGQMQRAGTQLKHRSLNALLGTPKGQLGKAVLPTRSPFEERQANAENVRWEDGRPPKRQRIEQPAAWSVTRTTKPSKSAAKQESPLPARKTDLTKQRKDTAQVGHHRLASKEVIELSDDEEEPEKFLPGFSSDVLAPPSSPAKKSVTSKKTRPEETPRSSSPAFQRQKTPPGLPCRKDDTRLTDMGAPLPGAWDKHLPGSIAAASDGNATKQPQPLDSPQAKLRDAQSEVTRPQVQQARPPQPSSTGSKVGQTLRMSASSSKKRTLLCQAQLSKKPQRVYSNDTENAIGNLLDVASQGAAVTKPAVKSQRKQLEERLAKIRRKTAPEADDTATQPAHVDETTTVSTRPVRDSTSVECRPQTPAVTHATELAELDQMIMPLATKRASLSPSALPSPGPENRPLRRVVSEIIQSAPPKRVPGAPMRFTPSPSKKADVNHASATVQQPEIPTQAKMGPPPKPRMKKPMQRSVSLNTAATGTSAVILSKPFQAPKAPVTKVAEPEKPPDPWSREAFDLFSWRPPGWDEEGWCVREVAPTE